MLRDGLPLEEPCFNEDGRGFSLSLSIPPASFSSLDLVWLIEAGFFDSVGEGRGDVEPGPFDFG